VKNGETEKDDQCGFHFLIISILRRNNQDLYSPVGIYPHLL